VGDINGNGIVDEDDLSIIVQVIMGQVTDEETRKKADVNHDEVVNAADLVSLANLILFGKVTP